MPMPTLGRVTDLLALGFRTGLQLRLQELLLAR